MSAKKKTIPDPVARARAAAFVMAKYRGRPLDCRTADCIRMARTLLVKRGHKVPKLPRYASARGALRALKAAGFANLTELFDSLGLERVAPARLLTGDLAVVLDEAGIGAAFVWLGNGMALGWHEDVEGAEVIAVNKVETGYRT